MYHHSIIIRFWILATFRFLTCFLKYTCKFFLSFDTNNLCMDNFRRRPTIVIVIELHCVTWETMFAFPGTSFYDNRTGEVWRVVVNMEMLVQLFIHCYMSTTRAGLLHYVLTRTRDFFLIKRASPPSIILYPQV